MQRQADGAGVPVLSDHAVETIRQLRGFAIPWEQVAAAVGSSGQFVRAIKKARSRSQRCGLPKTQGE